MDTIRPDSSEPDVDIGVRLLEEYAATLSDLVAEYEGTVRRLRFARVAQLFLLASILAIVALVLFLVRSHLLSLSGAAGVIMAIAGFGAAGLLAYVVVIWFRDTSYRRSRLPGLQSDIQSTSDQLGQVMRICSQYEEHAAISKVRRLELRMRLTDAARATRGAGRVLETKSAVTLDNVLADLRSRDIELARDAVVTATGRGWLHDGSLRNADLHGAALSQADLSQADLRSADLSGTRLQAANLRNADLSFCDLRAADLSGADLTSANLENSDLTGANLARAVLNGSRFAHAILRQTILTGSAADDADFTDVVADENTRWPDGTGGTGGVVQPG